MTRPILSTLSVRVPFAVRKRGGRKLVITPDGETHRPRLRVDSALVKALARAHRWQRMLENGVSGSMTELAAAEKINRSYVCRVLRLTLLAPEIVEAIMDGRQPEGVTLPRLMEGFPVEWEGQQAGEPAGTSCSSTSAVPPMPCPCSTAPISTASCGSSPNAGSTRRSSSRPAESFSPPAWPTLGPRASTFRNTIASGSPPTWTPPGRPWAMTGSSITARPTGPSWASISCEISRKVSRPSSSTAPNSLSRKSWVQERVHDVDVATQKLAALCSADAKCGEAYDVRALIEQAMGLFDEGPIETTYTDPSDPDIRIDLTLTGSDLASLIFEFQTGQIAIRSLPAILAAIVADGRTSAAAVLGDVKGSAILASRGATLGSSAILMHMAVVCSDDPVTSADDMIIDADASAYARAYGASVLEEYIQFCRAVDVPSLPDDTDVDVTTDVPVLVLAGDLDARTPAIRSELVATTLPRANFVLFPEGTHVQLGEINLCAGEILRAFLADPDAAPETSCIAAMPRRGFVLPDGTISIDAAR